MLQYPLDYDATPPRARFVSIPFHPSIDAALGTPCLHVLASPDAWQAHVRAHGGPPRADALLLSLQVLLSDPASGLQHPAHVAAAVLLSKDPARFAAMARECVAATQRMQQGLAPFAHMAPRDPFAASLHPQQVR